MQVALCFFLLLFASLFSEEEKVAHFEGCPSGVAGGWVNVISGSIVNFETDLVIPGVEPLSITRSPLYSPGKLLPQIRKESWNFPFMEKICREFDHLDRSKENLTIYQGTQELLSFKNGSPNKFNCRQYELKDHPKGFTTPISLSAGRAFLTNYHIHKHTLHSMTLDSGSGELRIYRGDSAQPTYKTIWLPLEQIHSQNGFSHQFRYDTHQKKQGVTIVAPTTRETAYYGFQDNGDNLSINSFDGRQVEYHFLNGSNCRLLDEVKRSDGAPVKYSYTGEELSSIKYPDGRETAFIYWKLEDHIVQKGKPVKLSKADDKRSKGKVQKLLQPSGSNGEMIQTHSFDYHWKGDDRGGWTTVVDCEGHKDEYLIDRNYRLKEIRHYRGLNNKIFVEKFV